MISVVNRKRRIVVYGINALGLLAYPLFFVLRKKWKDRKAALLARLKAGEALTVAVTCADRLGDLLFLTPALRALRTSFPRVRLVLITNRTGQELFRNNPSVDEIILVDMFWLSRSLVSLPQFLTSFRSGYLRGLREVRKRKIDLLLEMKGDFRNILFFDIWTRAGCTAGYALSGFGWMLDWEMPHAENRHEIDAKLGVVRNLGGDARDRRMEVLLSGEDERFADTFLHGRSGRVAVLHVGGTWGPRIWPLGNFIEVGRRLAETYGATTVLIGDEREERQIDECLRAIPGAVALVNAPIARTAAVIGRAALFVGSDSGPLHLARAMRTPLIGLFGPEDVWRVGPETDGIALRHVFPCAPCGQVRCDQQPNCVESISVEEVWQAVRKMLDRQQ